MLTIKLNNIIMEYGGRRLFNIEAASVYSNDKIGIIGANGSGKTTLLDIIAGRTRPISGSAELYSGFSYIDQLGLPQGDVCYDIDYSWAADDEPMSGGEIKRRKLAEGFGTDAGILLCDEPTSNLDEPGIVRLETALKGFKGTLLLVSHDRQLLDAVGAQRYGKLTAESTNTAVIIQAIFPRKKSKGATNSKSMISILKRKNALNMRQRNARTKPQR